MPQVQQPWPYQQPAIGNTRQPFTYQAQGSTRQPVIGTTQQPNTYQATGQTPFTYQYRSPFTYATQGITQTTYCLLYTSPSPRD